MFTAARSLCVSLLIGFLSGCISTVGMSGKDAEVLTVINWILRAPLILIATPIVVLLGWKIIDSVMRARRNAKIERVFREDTKKAEASSTYTNQERQRQIEELKAALPQTAPQRMRATIRVNQTNKFVLLREDLTRKLENVNAPHYAVDMILEMSEEYRGVIQEQHLSRIVVEKVPKYNGGQILNILGEQERYIDSLQRTGKLEDHVALEALKQTPQRDFQSYQAETRDVTLGDYLRVPYTRIFDTKPEANDYADRLKTTILPKVREMIEKNQQRDFSETVEL